MTECSFKLCSHRAADGSKCGAPALRQSDFCRHHGRVHRPPVTFPDYVTRSHTRLELLAAIQRTTQDMLNGTITVKFCGQILNEISKRIQILKRPPTAANTPSTTEQTCNL